MIYGVIVAGGVGARMGADIPKQFLQLGDKPILILTLEVFLASSLFDRVAVGVHPDWVEYASGLVRDYFPDARNVRIVPGGSERNETVRLALIALQSERSFSDNDIAVTHDAVRPFITKSLLQANIEAAERYGCVNTVIPCHDSLLYSENGAFCDKLLDRTGVYRVQTPQSFPAKEWLTLYGSLSAQERSRLTDCCGVYSVRNLPVCLVRGLERNIKITSPDDLSAAGAFLTLHE